jgi:AAA domain
MLIWLNGAFGVGKTQTAHELQRRLRDAHVADPELLGFAMHKMLPAAARGDFQDLPQWRAGVVATLLRAEAANDGPVIVPMTVVRDDYFEEIVGGLRSEGVGLRHYALVATPETLRGRLRQRLAYVGSRLFGGDETWAFAQIDRCVSALAADRYATHVPTDERSVHEVVETVAAHAGLTLERPRLRPARYQLRRLSVGVRHVRL